MIRDWSLFFGEFRRNFRTTGAIAPSGPALCAALARTAAESRATQRILEVGPGTGVVTRRLAAAAGPSDTLDLVEINPVFAERLRHKLQSDTHYAAIAPRTRVLCAAVEEAELSGPYDVVVSGIPLNNFAPPEVERILTTLTALLKEGGTLSFFEYAGIRPLKGLLSRAEERGRLAGIGEVMREAFAAHDWRRETVWPNLPPAWVHHLRKRRPD